MTPHLWTTIFSFTKDLSRVLWSMFDGMQEMSLMERPTLLSFKGAG